MGNYIKITLANIDRVIQDIDRYSSDLAEEIDFEIQACALDIVKDAKQAAARNLGVLARGISQVKVAPFQYRIISAANYSAFVEFGTKRRVQIPAGWEDVAKEFKGLKLDSGGMTFEDAINLWGKQKGIPKDRWHGIYLKLLFVGANPHPFLIPAFIANTNKLEQRLNNLLNAA